MRKLTKTLLTAAMLSAASLANASPLFIDNGVDLDMDGNTQTDVFSSFVFNEFSPTSAYLDLEGDGIQNGTLVFDSGSFDIANLSPLSFRNSLEGFNTVWGLEVEYELFGFAGIAEDFNSNGFFDAGDTLAAQFVDGYFTMNYVDVNGSQPFLSLDVTGSAFNINQGVNFSIFGQPVSASNALNSETPFFGSTGFGDIINTLDPVNLGALATLIIGDGSQAPTLDAGFSTTTFQDNVLASLGLSTLPQTAQWLTRTTDVNTGSLTLEVSAPSTLALFGLSLLGLGVSRRFSKK
jgi:hypothetical protein